MPHFEQDGITFDLPETLTMRQMLRYDSAVEGKTGEAMYERLWAGACTVVENFNGPVKPEPETLDRPMDSVVLAAIKWVCLAVFSWSLKIKAEAVSKNS